MSSDVIISARNLTKTYRAYAHPLDRFIPGRAKRCKEFHALNDVSFDIKRGETVGIIGRNGSGKSTLLQLVCGIRKPTSGTLQVSGRISALLELGAGFHPEFTGRENVFLQGAIQGMSRQEMEARFDDIAAFADIGEYIDQPVKTYSSGMFVRLAFAVAVCVEPDILVVDEALAVGDMVFQGKCFQRINHIREQGGSILFVSHSAEQIAHYCDRALLLAEGKSLSLGKTVDVLAHYVNLAKREMARVRNSSGAGRVGVENGNELFQHHLAYNSFETRWGDAAATIVDVWLIQDGQENPTTFMPSVEMTIRMQVRFHQNIEKPIYGLTIKTPDGAIVLNCNSRELKGSLSALPQSADSSLHVNFSFNPFLDMGDYLISLGVVSDSPSGLQPHDRRYDAIRFRIGTPTAQPDGIHMNPSIRIDD